MFRISEVVKNLIGINVIIFLIISLAPDPIKRFFILFPFGSDQFMPVQIFTHMFSHISPGHIFWNMLTLFFFGPDVERHIGEKKFLILYFVSGLGSLLLHWILASQAPVLGASGANFGVLVAYAYFFGDRKVMLLFPPIPIKAKILVLIFVAMDLYNGMSGTATGIAHFAHLGGALFGFLLLLYWNRTGR